MKTIAISAAEASGDLLASTIIEELKKKSNIKIKGLAGDVMEKAGCEVLWHTKKVSVMGFSEVLKKLPSILKLQKEVINYFTNNPADIFIGVDAPDFNFKIEKALKAKGIKTIHFVSPSIWAWRQDRVKKIAKSTDLILCLFPFEVEFYKKYKISAEFVGHPLAQKLKPRVNYKKTNNILLMPGSRYSEIKRLLPPLLESAKLMKTNNKGLKFSIALVNDEQLNFVKSLANDNFNIVINKTHDIMKKSDLVILASGTASLEAALIGVPMIVVYKLSYFSYIIAKQLIKIPYVSLPNVIAGKKIVPELIQDDANVHNIYKNASKLLNKDNSMLITEFKKIHNQLNKNTTSKVATKILNLIK